MRYRKPHYLFAESNSAFSWCIYFTSFWYLNPEHVSYRSAGYHCVIVIHLFCSFFLFFPVTIFSLISLIFFVDTIYTLHYSTGMQANQVDWASAATNKRELTVVLCCSVMLEKFQFEKKHHKWIMCPPRFILIKIIHESWLLLWLLSTYK